MKDSRKISIDEAYERRGELGVSKERFEEKVAKKTDDLFTDLRCLPFSWVDQPDGSKKLMSRLPNGKVVFLDKSEDPSKVRVGVSYICAVYEREKVAFAKIICEEYIPKINILPSKMVSSVWRDGKGRVRRKMHGPFPTFEERLIDAIKMFDSIGTPEVLLVFVGNKKNV